VARSVLQIYEALDNNQADHQALVVEIEGMIFNHLVSILTETGSNLSYIAPRVVERCKLQPQKKKQAMVGTISHWNQKNGSRGQCSS
jgi:hypothetical protein